VSNVLFEFERTGYRFRLDGDRVLVQGSGELLNSEAMEKLRRHKAEIRAACSLRDFVRLVQVDAALHHCRLLNLAEIEAQLSESDRADLLTCPKPERQAWAEALAFRLTRLDQARDLAS
jgi:hypothetical protein